MKGDLLAEGSYDAAVEGCEGVFHTAASLAIIKSDPKVALPQFRKTCIIKAHLMTS